MMSQMSPGASQNVSDALEREEKDNDGGEKEMEALEEVEAVNLCTSNEKKKKKLRKEKQEKQNCSCYS